MRQGSNVRKAAREMGGSHCSLPSGICKNHRCLIAAAGLEEPGAVEGEDVDFAGRLEESVVGVRVGGSGQTDYFVPGLGLGLEPSHRST